MVRHFLRDDDLTPAQASVQIGPLLSKLRAVLSRRFAAQLFGVGASTFCLKEILDGGVLLVRLFIEDMREKTLRPFDLPGFVLTGIGLASLAFAFENIGRGELPIVSTTSNLPRSICLFRASRRSRDLRWAIASLR